MRRGLYEIVTIINLWVGTTWRTFKSSSGAQAPLRDQESRISRGPGHPYFLSVPGCFNMQPGLKTAGLDVRLGPDGQQFELGPVNGRESSAGFQKYLRSVTFLSIL